VPAGTSCVVPCGAHSSRSRLSVGLLDVHDASRKLFADQQPPQRPVGTQPLGAADQGVGAQHATDQQRIRR
jgi:hypothetical protein